MAKLKPSIRSLSVQWIQYESAIPKSMREEVLAVFTQHCGWGTEW